MIIRMLWKSTQADPVNFRGHFYNLENARLDLHPQKDRNLPIYIASLGSKLSLQLTGKIGDGWLPWFNTPETFKERSSVIDRAAKKAGRTPQEIEKSAVVYLAATSNRDRQKQILDSMKQEVVVLTSSTRLAKLGHRISAQPSENYAYQKCLASSEDTIRAQKLGMELPDTVAERFLVTGTTDDCITQLKQLVAAGATHLIIRDMLWANQLEQFKVTLNLIANEVIPAFN
jgi:alkanesulfonate monooxygenase SsuD/methylene tetrahydromethanopterin reductase-like flavin-dependent oxidoreductase (luciferase family)